MSYHTMTTAFAPYDSPNSEHNCICSPTPQVKQHIKHLNMPPFRATPAITALRTAGTSSVGLFPRPFAAVSPHPAAVTLCVQRQNFFLPALQQRFASIGGSNFTSPSTRKHPSSSVSSAMDEMIDADIDISDPPEAVGASNAATAKAVREQKGWEGDDMLGGNKML